MALCLLSAAAPVTAGRPLASDDAGTAEAGQCQLEGWAAHAGSQRSLVLAAACGLVPGLELGTDYSRFSPRGSVPSQAELALKWVPAAWTLKSAAGALNFGFKLGGAWDRAANAGWQSVQTSLLVLTTLQPSPALALHGNLGTVRDRAAQAQVTLLNLGLAWTPRDELLLFAERLGNSRHAVLGGTVYSAGARWWLAKDTLGLDLTASREAGAAGPTRWTLGLGWYGVGL